MARAFIAEARAALELMLKIEVATTVARGRGELRDKRVELDEETAVRIAEAFLRRRGRLPGVIEATARELPPVPPEGPEEGQ